MERKKTTALMYANCLCPASVTSSTSGALKSVQGSENRTPSHGESSVSCVVTCGCTVDPSLTGYTVDPSLTGYRGDPGLTGYTVDPGLNWI